MNFLNACMVAKTCRDGRQILALPENMYAEVHKIAQETDGHRLLRVMEIFAEVEMKLKYATSPRILFETAVLKAGMPQEDYDIESLLSRIASLEKAVAEGVVINNEAPMSALNEIPAPMVKEEKPIKPAVKAVEEPRMEEEFYLPPDEEETGGYAYFDNPPPAPEKVKKVVAPEPTHTKPILAGDAKATFGTFLRTMRKTARNGVLLTLCMDLDGEYEEGVFILYTTSDTIHHSLMKPEHYSLIAQAFENMGIGQDGFAIRKRGKQSDNVQKKVEEIQSTFAGVPIDVK